MDNDSYWDEQWSPQKPVLHRRGKLSTVLFLLISLLLCVSAAIMVPGGLGFIVGYDQLQTQNHEDAIQHFNRGLGYLVENYPELADAEFQIALKYDSTYEPARQKLRDLQATFGERGTPQPEQEDNRVAASLFNDSRDLVSQKQWSDAIIRLEQLRTLKPDYHTSEVNDMLFQAYVAGGKDAVGAGQIELARERFEAALTVHSSDAEVQRQRDLAVLYLDGQQAVGYNWQKVIQNFSTLYQADPNYDDIKMRLIDAYNQYGDLAGKQNAWCLAVREYDNALALIKDNTLSDKRTQAMSLCKQAISATPTPAASTGSDYIWTKSTLDKQCKDNGDISGVVHDALGHPIANLPIGYYGEGVSLITARTNANGQYQFVLGKDASLLFVVVLGIDGKSPVSLAVDALYPGGSMAGCHIVIDWQKVE